MRSVRRVALLIGSGVVGLMAGAASAQSGSTAAGDAPIAELQRCRELREAAATDARCQAAYKQSRDQFFAPGKPYEPEPIQMNPETPKPKLIRPE